MTAEIHGQCDEHFLPLKDVFRKNFEDGLEVGASLAVAHKGNLVVDLWAGHRNFARTKPWEKDTIVGVYSTTKIPTILCVLMAIDRGLIDLDAPVAKYWPEFAAGGKERVTVRHAITHCAGVPGFDPPISFMAQFDWDATVANIAGQRHWFDGKRRFCYHPVTYGFLLGEILRRADGRRPAQFFREEVAAKCGADFRIEAHRQPYLDRMANLGYLKPPGLALSSDPIYARAFESLGPEENWHTWQNLILESPASSGIGNARSIARLCAIIAMGGTLDGVRYLSKETVDEASREQVCEHDEYLGNISMGLGLGLNSQWFPAPTPTSFHWGGHGGSWGVMDQKTGISAGYAMNNMIVGDGAEDLQDVRRVRHFEALGAVMNSLETLPLRP